MNKRIEYFNKRIEYYINNNLYEGSESQNLLIINDLKNINTIFHESLTVIHYKLTLSLSESFFKLINVTLKDFILLSKDEKLLKELLNFLENFSKKCKK